MKISTKLFIGFFCIIFGLVGISINLSVNTKRFSEKAQEINQNIEVLKEIGEENAGIKAVQDSFLMLYSTVSEFSYVKNMKELDKLNKKLDNRTRKFYEASAYLNLQNTLNLAVETLNGNLEKYVNLKLEFIKTAQEIAKYRQDLNKDLESENLVGSKKNLENLGKLNEKFNNLSKEMEEVYLGKIVVNLETIYNSVGPYIKKKNDQNLWTIDAVAGITAENEKLLKKTEKKNNLYIGLILLFSILVFFIMVKSIKKPLKKLTLIGQRLSNLDLTVEFEKKYSNNETGILSQSFKVMLETLKKTIFDIKEVSICVKNESENISTSVLKTAATTEELSASINNITDSIEDSFNKLNNIDSKVEEISEGSITILDTVKNIKDNNEKVLTQTRSEKDNVLKTLKQVTIIANDIKENSHQINELKTLSDEIHVFIEKIYNVTEQTNLLALNAAIEASRAGEAGKGFAVVADEIRKLANDSRKTAEEIEDKINHISEKIDISVKNSNANKEKLEQTTEEIKGLSVTIENIVDSFGGVSKNLTTIYTSIESQSSDLQFLLTNSNEMTHTFKDIDTSMKEIDLAVLSTAEIINSLGDGAQELTETSEKLNEMLYIFKQ